MAIVLADDFQQINRSMLAASYNGIFVQDTVANQRMYTPFWNGLGYESPACFSSSLEYQSRPSVYYELSQGALALMHHPTYTGVNVGQYRGLMRQNIRYKGDTLNFSMCISLHGGYVASGNFLTLNDGEAALGVDDNGFFTLNGESTTLQAFYPPAIVKCYIDLVFKPTTLEMWSGPTLVASVPRMNIPINKFYFSPYGMGANNAFVMWLHSLALIDNSPGFSQRMGRRVVKTEPIASITSTESDVVKYTSASNLAMITRMASGKFNDADGYTIGYLGSPKGYVRNEFTATRSNNKVPAASFVTVQHKRQQAAGDGLGVRSYITLGGQRYYSEVVVPANSWNLYPCEIPIPSSQSFTDLVFGYEHDYRDMNNIWIDDRAKVEVYGDIPYATMNFGYINIVPSFAALSQVQSGKIGAYVFDYAKSNLNPVKTNITNLSYQQEQV